MLDSVNSYHGLPFVAEGADGRVDFWKPNSEGRYTALCERGRAYAQMLLGYMRFTGDAQILSNVLKAMVLNRAPGGMLGGVEIGFMAAISETLVLKDSVSAMSAAPAATAPGAPVALTR